MLQTGWCDKCDSEDSKSVWRLRAMPFPPSLYIRLTSSAFNAFPRAIFRHLSVHISYQKTLSMASSYPLTLSQQWKPLCLPHFSNNNLRFPLGWLGRWCWAKLVVELVFYHFLKRVDENHETMVLTSCGGRQLQKWEWCPERVKIVHDKTFSWFLVFVTMIRHLHTSK